jgi:hypothetical protein
MRMYFTDTALAWDQKLGLHYHRGQINNTRKIICPEYLNFDSLRTTSSKRVPSKKEYTF